MGRKVLIIGGSGYLGQFLVEDLATTEQVAYTHHSSIAPSTFASGVTAFWTDLKSGETLQDAFTKFGPVDVVVNCAAISSPAACEKDAATARAVNVPVFLLECLEQHKQRWQREPLLVHISTDQVYDGTKPLSREEDACEPVNVYGITKREAEVLIQERWRNHVILRSSIIYGAQCSTPVSRMLFLQFIVSSLEAGKPTAFFDDEFRSPIYVQDIIKIVRTVLDKADALQHRLYNMGGPERLSRLDMALRVADAYGFDSQSSIIAVPSMSVNRGVASPADISMSVDRIQTLGVVLTPFSTALEELRDEVLSSTHE